MLEKRTFSGADYAVFALLLLVSSAIGVYYAFRDRKSKNNRNQLSLSGQIGIIPVSMSLMSSYVSAITILSVPGEIYTHGTQWWMTSVAIIISIVLTDLLFLPTLYSLNFTSINKYFFKRYNSNLLRSVCSLTYILGTIFYMGAVLYGPSLAISSVTDLNIWTSVITIGAVCTFYTSLGGLRAVIWTDFFQILVMFAGLLLVFIKIATDLGGGKEVFRIAGEGGRLIFFNTKYEVFSPVPSIWDAVFSSGLFWISSMTVSQTSIQRYCGMSTYKKARIVLWLNIPGVCLLSSLACMCGVALYAFYHLCDPLTVGTIEKSDQLISYYVMEAFHTVPGLPGVFVACVFSASLSTVSSGLNAMAAVTWSDFVKHFVTVKGKRQIYITKIIAALYGLLAIGMAFLSQKIGSILRASAMLSGPLLSSLFVIFALGMFCPFVNGKGAVTGMLASVAVSIWISVGAATVQNPDAYLPMSVEKCDSNFTVLNSTSFHTMKEEFQLPNDYTRIYHISPFFAPQIAFFISFFLTIIISLLTGGARNLRIEPKFIHPIFHKERKYRLPEQLQNLLMPKFHSEKQVNSNLTEDGKCNETCLNNI